MSNNKEKAEGKIVNEILHDRQANALILLKEAKKRESKSRLVPVKFGIKTIYFVPEGTDIEKWKINKARILEKLDRDSPESRIVRKYISKTPEGQSPDNGEGSNLTVIIPWFKEVDKRVYNYLGNSAKKLLLKSFDQMVERSMLDEIGKVETYFSGKISSIIYSWMEKHGIEDNQTNWYTLSQKYYRLRKKCVKQS
jgi:hypothetical protein